MDPTEFPIELKLEILSYIMQPHNPLDYFDWELEEIYDFGFGK